MKRKTLIGAVVLALLAAVAAVGAAAASKAAPKTTSPPTVEGEFQVNETVTATNGGWDNSPTSFDYQWQRCNDSGSGCANIAGETAKTYKLVSADVDHTIRVLVTAANTDGKDTANSQPSPIVSGSDAPRNTARPAISGTTQVGETLTVSNGEWTGGARTFTYQWQTCDQNGGNCTDVSGATAKTYGVRSADSGNTIRAEVTAANAAGKTTVTTDRTSQVKAAGTPTPSPTPAGCDGSKVAAAANLQLPVRLMIDRFSFSPSVLTRGTRSFTARVHVSDTCNRSVGNAQLWSTAIPFNQTTTVRGETGSDGWAVLTFNMKGGFPANPGRQQILAMLVRATKPGGSVLADVSTRRTVALRVNLHR